MEERCLGEGGPYQVTMAISAGAEGEPLIVAITGASGAVFGVRALEQLRAMGVPTHLVVSKSALLTLNEETGLSLADLKERATICYPAADIGAAISSGSFPTRGMLVAPCSIKTLSEIAYGITSSLVSRAADVVLKERRRLVLMVRETPLHLGHIKSMELVTQAGAIVYPPVPAFYSKPRDLDELVDHTVGRALDLFGLDSGKVRRWRAD